MSTKTETKNNVRAEEIRASLLENHRSISEWSDYRRCEAEATFNSRPLAAYYESTYFVGDAEE